VLEIGFGGGFLLSRVASELTGGWQAGVDISPSMVALGKRRFRQEIKAGVMRLDCAPVEYLPYPPGIFNKVCSVNSIFYWHDIDKAFQEIGRVLLPSGRLVLCFTQQESLERKPFADYIHRFETEEVVERLGAHGFRDFHLEQDADRHRNFSVMCCLKG
jgi:ubiquinone/menaquinone biosynthesis C-methylase UbiE